DNPASKNRNLSSVNVVNLLVLLGLQVELGRLGLAFTSPSLELAELATYEDEEVWMANLVRSDLAELDGSSSYQKAAVVAVVLVVGSDRERALAGNDFEELDLVRVAPLVFLHRPILNQNVLQYGSAEVVQIVVARHITFLAAELSAVP